MIKTAVIGATGYAGAELVRILKGHPEAELVSITSRQYSGSRISSVYPALRGVCDMVLETFSRDEICQKADIIFTALPHKLPMEIIPGLIKNGKKVIDLSADFRFQNIEAYEAHYQPHTAKKLIKEAVYGLCEVYDDKIKKARIIGNPGCYPTSVLLPLIPLLKQKIIDPDSIISDSKSGVSGAGRSPSVTTLYCQVTESFKPYKVASHRHNPEMDEILTREAGKNVSITFVPHLLPMSRGMLTTTYATIKDDMKEDAIREVLLSYYKGRQFIRILPKGEIPATMDVRGTNYCDIGLVKDDGKKRLILISAIDNLVKGASGQAVQNMNIMCGLDENTGLDQIPYPV